MKFITIKLLLTILTVQYCNGQASMVPTSSDPVAATPVITSRQQLRICNDQDKLSNVFCKCSETVISCDFSLFNEFLAKDTSFNENIDKNHPLELELYGYVFPQNTKRVCLCNTPETVHLNFTKSHFLPLDNVEVHRFDLFNLSGKVHFNGGFSENFHGDLYIANVTEIEAFHGFEFGRGRDISLQDVQNLECCSPIKATQTYEKPTLFIENSTIGLIQTRGIDDNHLWRTLIFKSTDFNNVNVEGILFDSYKGYNVAIIGGKFKNVKHHSLIFQDAQGVFMAKNSFHYKDGVHAYFFGSRSRLNDSHIFLVENSFENQVYFDLDARHIVSWYNAYDLWDSITFELLNHTSFGPNTGVAQDRTLSFKYNLVYYASLPEGSVEFGINSHVIIFDNVLGPCNCTLMNITDQTLKTTANWCHAGKVYRKDGKCSIKLDAALEQCEKHNSVDLEKSCADKHISVENLNLKSMLTKDMTKMSIDSSFVSKIIDDFHFLFEPTRAEEYKSVLNPSSVYEIADDKKPAHHGQNDEHVSSNQTRTARSTNNVVVPVIATIAVLVTLIVGVIVFRRYKYRLLRRFGHHELAESRDVLS